MTFALKPGEPVSAAKLAERYNVSRTPARETLVRLNTEGMVDIIPQSKSVISKINVARARQEWFVRKTLEIGMTDAFFENLKPADIEEMKAYAKMCERIGRQPRDHELSYEYLVNDNQFHAVTYRVAGEALAAEVIGSTTMAHYSRVRLLADLDDDHKDRTIMDHEKLIRTIETGDREGYRHMLSVHLGRVIGDMMEMQELFPDFFEAGEKESL